MKHLLIAMVALCINVHNLAQSAETPITTSEHFSVTTSLGDNASYVAGDTIQFLITTETSGYLSLFLQDANGNIQQLLPNTYQPSLFIEPGYFIAFPEENAPYKLTASAPFGKEVLFAVLSENQRLDLDKKILTRKSKRKAYSMTDLESLIIDVERSAVVSSVGYQVLEGAD
ncbi:DUF4384 domain-containing protein [Reinekea forsetii]|nr:DUF4384 domain-containing protein [Reinekea forsetii]